VPTWAFPGGHGAYNAHLPPYGPRNQPASGRSRGHFATELRRGARLPLI